MLVESMRTLIIGAYGYGNLGDEAILDGLLEIFGRENTTVMSYDPKETQTLHNVRAISQGDLSEDYDRIIIGGGALLGNAHERYFQYGLHFKERGSRLILYSLGLWGYNFKTGQWEGFTETIKHAIMKADEISVRTREEQFFLQKLFPNQKIKFKPDPAFIIKLEKVRWLDVPEGAVGISLSFGIKSSVIGDLRRELKSINDEQIIPVISVLHKSSRMERDDEITRKWFKELGISWKPEYVQFWHPRQLKWIISQLNLLYSARKHPIIFALSTGVKSISLNPYDFIVREYRIPVL